GRFRAQGLPAGEQPLVARAAGCAPWTGTCVVPLAGAAHVRIALDRGVRCTGRVVAADGRGVPGAEVRAGVRTELAFHRTRTAPDGAFALDGLPPGECELAASHPDAGKGMARIAAAAGATVACDLVLSRGVVVRGIVQFGPGEPLAGARVYAMP